MQGLLAEISDEGFWGVTGSYRSCGPFPKLLKEGCLKLPAGVLTNGFVTGFARVQRWGFERRT